MVFTWPVIQVFRSAIPSSRLAFDACMQAFIMGWDAQALLANPLQLFHAPIFHPEPYTLTYMDHLLGETIVGSPALAIFHSLASAYNTLFVLSFALSGWATYRLTRLLGVPRPGAFLAGFVFAFGPYRFGNLDLLNQLQTQFLPLGLFFALRYFQRLRVRDAALVALTLVIQVYFGWYYAFYLAIAVTILAAIFLLRRGFRLVRPRIGTLALLGLLSFLLIAPVTAPYALKHQVLPEFHRTLGESALYSADVADYFKRNAGVRVPEPGGHPVGRQPYWPGLIAVSMGVIGAAQVWKRRSREGMDLLALTVSSFILSLGPILHAWGARIWIPLPYAALYFIVPGFSSMRAPARFAALVALGVSVLAGIGYAALRERLKSRPILGSSFAVLAFALAVAFASPRPLSTVTLPAPDRLPPVYAWLKDHHGKDPILEVPVPLADNEGETHSFRQLYVLFHGHPRLDGTSGFLFASRCRNFRARGRCARSRISEAS